DEPAGETRAGFFVARIGGIRQAGYPSPFPRNTKSGAVGGALIAKKCRVCGVEFTTKYTVKIYCSRRCNVAAWKKANPERLREHREKDRLRRKNKTLCKVYFSKCKDCGSPFSARYRRLKCESCREANKTRCCKWCSKAFGPSSKKGRLLFF